MAFVLDENDEEVENKLFPILNAYFHGVGETFATGDIFKMNPQAPKKMLEDIAKTIVEKKFKEKEILMFAAFSLLVTDEKNIFHGVEDVSLFVEAEELLFNLKFLEEEDIYPYHKNHKKTLSQHGKAIEKIFLDTLEEHKEVKKISHQSLSFATSFIVDVLYECILSSVTYTEYLEHRGIEKIQ